VWAFYSVFLFGSALAAVTLVALVVVLREPQGNVELRREGPAEKRPPYRRLITRPVLAFLIVAATSHFAMGSWEVVWSLWLRELGASMAFVGATWMAFSLPMLLAFLGGRLADRHSRFVLMYGGYFVVSCTWLVYGIASHLWLFLAFAVIEGLATALSMPAKQAFLVQVSPSRWLGAIQGLEASVLQLAALMGTLTAPLLYTRIQGATIAVAGVVSLLGLAITAPILGREWKRLAAGRGLSVEESPHAATASLDPDVT
jgi:hypothetical protein